MASREQFPEFEPVIIETDSVAYRAAIAFQAAPGEVVENPIPDSRFLSSLRPQELPIDFRVQERERGLVIDGSNVGSNRSISHAVKIRIGQLLTAIKADEERN